jgi:hypothetical protein
MIDSIANKQQLNEHVISSINNLLLNNSSNQAQSALNNAMAKYESEPYAKAVFEAYSPLLNVLKEVKTKDTSFNYTQLSHHLQSIVAVAYNSELWPAIAAANLYYKITDSILPVAQLNKKGQNTFSTTIPPIDKKVGGGNQKQRTSTKSDIVKIYTDRENITHISFSTISLGGDEYVVYDMMGKKVVANNRPQNEKTISINIPPGNYIFVSKQNNTIIRTKFYVPHQ